MDTTLGAPRWTFTSARVLSIKHDARQRSTEDRLNGVAALGIDSPQSAQRILDGQSELLGFVLEQQLADLDAGVPPSPTVVAGRLDKSRRVRLKTALGAADEAVGLASEGLI